ncbi:hypothetical protein M0802_008320 [Mischocyttarus mexicanus]|nr:hypothetical protein M0802_008320 [Mischocyttarus mexicanus]
MDDDGSGGSGGGQLGGGSMAFVKEKTTTTCGCGFQRGRPTDLGFDVQADIVFRGFRKGFLARRSPLQESNLSSLGLPLIGNARPCGRKKKKKRRVEGRGG